MRVWRSKTSLVCPRRLKNGTLPEQSSEFPGKSFPGSSCLVVDGFGSGHNGFFPAGLRLRFRQYTLNSVRLLLLVRRFRRLLRVWRLQTPNLWEVCADPSLHSSIRVSGFPGSGLGPVLGHWGGGDVLSEIR